MKRYKPTIFFFRVRQVIICLVVALNLHSRQHLAQLQNAACRVHSAHLLSTQRDCGQLAEPAQHLFCQIAAAAAAAQRRCGMFE